MVGSRRSRRPVGLGPLRFGPVVLLLVATVVAGAASATTAPHGTPQHLSPAPDVPTTARATTPVAPPATTVAPTGAPDAPGVAWSALVNGLDLDPDSVSCPGSTLCVFSGGRSVSALTIFGFNNTK